MDNRQQQDERPDDVTLHNTDRQGNDKSPGEDAPGEIRNVVAETQRGKNKVDGDPSQPSDQPVEGSKNG